MVREVLEDWLQFLGEAQPGHIRSFTGKWGTAQFTKNCTRKGRSIKSLS